MVVLLPVLGAAAAAASLAALAMHRWTRVDPAAPHLTAPAIGDEVHRHRRAASFIRRQADARALTAEAMTLALAAVVGGAVIAGIVFAMVRTNSGLADLDDAGARFGASHAHPTATRVLKAVTDLGGTGTIVLLGIAVVIQERRRQRTRTGALFLAAVLVGQSVITNLVKVIVDRARPDLNQLAAHAAAAFPSGHASNAAAAWAAYALLLGRGRSRRSQVALAALGAGVAAAVATTRVLLGVHWITDVVAGLAVGWAWFAACSIAFGGRLTRFGAPAEVAEAVALAEEAAPGDGARLGSTHGRARSALHDPGDAPGGGPTDPR